MERFVKIRSSNFRQQGPFEEFEGSLKNWPCTGTFAFQRKQFDEKEENELERNKSRRRNVIRRLLQYSRLEVTEVWHALVRMTD